MSRFYKIIGVLLFLVNFGLLWGIGKVSEIFVTLMRLDESNGYMLTDEQEWMYFFIISIPMFLIQSVLLLSVFIYLKNKQTEKSTLILNVAIHALPFLWFVFKVYQFTIIAY